MPMPSPRVRHRAPQHQAAVCRAAGVFPNRLEAARGLDQGQALGVAKALLAACDAGARGSWQGCRWTTPGPLCTAAVHHAAVSHAAALHARKRGLVRAWLWLPHNAGPPSRRRPYRRAPVSCATQADSGGS